jgi:hypothetical protein
MVAKIHSDRLEELKKMVESSHSYFSSNYKSFTDNMRLVFERSLSEKDSNSLKSLEMPTLDFNVLTPYIDRLRGEFGKSQPQIEIKQNDDMADQAVVDVIDKIVRSVLRGSNAQGMDNDVYRDQLSGGFSVVKIYTDYVDNYSMEQAIFCKRVFDPTLCGFDTHAEFSHKGDGRYCFELVPYYKDDFKRSFPKVDVENLRYAKTPGSFSWSYNDKGLNDVLFVCEFYEKKFKNKTFYQVMQPIGNDSDAMVKKYLTEKEFMEYSSSLDIPLDKNDVKKVKRKVYTISRYRFIESEVLDYKETDNDILPLVFIDGDSITIKGKQITRSYCHNAIDLQRSRNFAGNALIDKIQNMDQTDTLMSERALPSNDAYLDAWNNPYKKHAAKFWKDIDDSGVPIPQPTYSPAKPIDPILYQTFSSFKDEVQSSLGAFDASSGENSNGASGRSILASTVNSNATAMPRMLNYISGMNQLAKGILHLIPKVYTTPKTMPVYNKHGNREYIEINNPINTESVMMNYDPKLFDIHISEGVNYELAKIQSVDTLIKLSSQLPSLAKALDSQGLVPLLDNVDVIGIDKIKSIVTSQQDTPPPPNLEMMALQLKQQKQQFDQQYKMMDLAQKAQKMNNEHAASIMKLVGERQRAMTELYNAHTQAQVTQAQLEIKRIDQAFEQYKFLINEHHELAKDEYSQDSAMANQNNIYS